MAQAMRRTNPTAPSRTKSEERTSLTMKSRRGWTAKPSFESNIVSVFRILAAELLGGEFELGVCLIDGDAGFETTGGEEEVSLVDAVGIELEG